ncbi:MAG: MBL fold metallo-hydrolase [Novosphingobium sp.]|jgi:glyoxylase-like metal-dependent hydrolase (beta-lactamase superfamily II)|nr:MBL fold metallo-hydrolase [Novosphingobium sp.]
MREVRTIPLITGRCRHPQRMTIRNGSWQPADFPAMAMLIVHPDEGPILFDTGYDPAFLAATRPFPERLYRWATPIRLEPGQDAASQCAKRGFDPAGIRRLILSHFHADHIAGTHRFANARIHCARSGLEAASSSGRFSGTRRGILRGLIPADFGDRARFFEDTPTVALPPDLHPFEHGADLLGDGSLLAVELPGHCPGHWGLVLRDKRWGLHFLVADAAWSLDAIRRNMPPPAMTTALLGHTGRARGTLDALHRLWRRNPEIRLTPCHCAERAGEAGGA